MLKTESWKYYVEHARKHLHDPDDDDQQAIVGYGVIVGVDDEISELRNKVVQLKELVEWCDKRFVWYHAEVASLCEIKEAGRIVERLNRDKRNDETIHSAIEDLRKTIMKHDKGQNEA